MNHMKYRILSRGQFPSRRQWLALAVLSSTLPLASVAVALENNNGEPIDAQAEFGYLSSNGNSDTQSVNGKFSLGYDLEKWRYHGFIMGLSASAADPGVASDELVVSAERYALDAQADRKLDDGHSLFAKVNYDDDRFSGFEYEALAAIGYGHQVVKTDRRTLRVEVGPGFRVAESVAGLTQEEALVATALIYDHKIGETSRFNQNLNIDAGDERTISTSVTSITAQIYGQLAMKFSLSIKHNSSPAIDELGVEKASVDKETSVNLVYSF